MTRPFSALLCALFAFALPALLPAAGCSAHPSPLPREASASPYEPPLPRPELAGGPSASAPLASSAAPAASAAPSALTPLGLPEAPPATPPEGMLLVPGGSFTMGSDDLGEPDEHPAHRVTLAPAFVDTTEVTNEAYQKCVDAGRCRPHDKMSPEANKLGKDAQYRKPRQPISAVAWDDAKSYCAFVGKRLPTEAEWEHAARGDDARIFPWGNTLGTHEEAVFGEATTAEVGSRPKGRGPYGHLDLAGNVWEWVADLYDPYAYRRDTAASGIPGSCEQIMDALNELRRQHKQGFTGSNPIPAECEHILRGGAFNYNAKGLRSSNRVHHPGRFRLVMSGFRCAKDAPAPAETEPETSNGPAAPRSPASTAASGASSASPP